MKKIFAISFLFIYLCSTTEFYQFLKIPALAGHYIEHKQDCKRITVLQFLKIHYLMDIKDADYDRDMQLPFKTHNKHVSIMSGNYMPLFERFSIHNPTENLEKKNFIIQDIFLYNSYLSIIWQPPRVF